jgi:hypothetical protein
MIKISDDKIERKVALVAVAVVGIDDRKQYYRMMMMVHYLVRNPDVDVDKYLRFDDRALMSKHVQYFYNENSHAALALDTLDLKEDELLGHETRNILTFYYFSFVEFPSNYLMNCCR